jgi:hypothetical protein
MREIRIDINRAKISSFAVDLNAERPRVHVNIDLFAGDKKITSFSMESADWLGKINFDISPSMIAAIINIGGELEQIVTTECQRRMTLIEAPATEVK